MPINPVDVVGNFQRGYQFGAAQKEQRRVEEERNQLKNLAPRVLQGDASAYQQAAAIDPGAAGQLQDAGDRQFLRLSNVVGIMRQAIDSGKPEVIQQAHQKVSPWLAEITGQPVPPQWTPEMLPNFERIEQQVRMAQSGQPQQQGMAPRVVGNALVDSSGNVLYEAPQKQDYQWSDRAGAWIPKPGAAGGQQTGVAGPERGDMEADIALANELIAAGIPEAQVDSFLTSRGQRTAGSQGSAPLAAIPVEGIGPRQGDDDAPSGYRWNSGRLEPIPGGPADKQNNPVAADLAKGEMGMRKELQDRVEKDRSILNMYQNVQSAANSPSAAGDLSMIFAFMKMLDPGSVVREQEFANAQNAAGVPDQIRNAYNKALNGQRLNPQQRADFVKQAQGLASAAQQRITGVTREYQGIADQYGWDPVRSTGMADFRGVQATSGTGPSAPEQSGPQPGTVEDGYRFRGGDPADPNNWERQ